MRFILSGIFGGVLAICEIHVIEEPVKFFVLFGVFVISMEIIEWRKNS